MMKPEILRALLADRELGELAPDVGELIDAYLAAVPAAQAEVDAVVSTLRTTRETIRRFPGLSSASETETESRVIPALHWFIPWLARAAAMIMVAALAGWIGYLVGHTTGPAEVKTAATVEDGSAGKRVDGLWTRYQVAYDSHSGAYVVEKQQ